MKYLSKGILPFIFLISLSYQEAFPINTSVTLSWPKAPEVTKIQFSGSIKELFQNIDLKKLLYSPYDIVAIDGQIYVTCRGRVVSFDIINKTYNIIGSNELKSPLGIALTGDGRLFISDGELAKIFVYSLKGELLNIISDPSLIRPCGIAINEKEGLIYVVDTKGHMVRVYSLVNYKPLKNIGSRGIAKKERFNFPTDIMTDDNGNIYIVDTGNFRIQILDKDGRYLKEIGYPGDAPGSFSRPKGIAMDSDGNIYITDNLFQNVQIFDRNANLLLFFGNNGEKSILGLPAGIAIDQSDRIYIVDQLGDIYIFKYIKSDSIK
jgi:DNA-binding beta-propeller fold protein YncE